MKFDRNYVYDRSMLFRRIPLPFAALVIYSLGAGGHCLRAAEELRVFPSSDNPTGTTRFEKVVAADSGLDFVIPIDTKHPDKRLYYSAMACGGVAAGDLDGDGWPELFFASGPGPNRLFHNLSENSRGLRFKAVEGSAGMEEADSWCAGASMIDIDNDGDLDVYVTRYDAPNRLFLNESTPGSFRFREAASEFGLDLVDASLISSFADFDRDGDLDLFLGCNAYYRKGGRPAEGIPMRSTPSGFEILPPWDRYFTISSIDPATGLPRYDECGRPNRLLRNDSGRFQDISAVAGLRSDPTHTNAALWWDFDSDGWLDLYVANDFDATDACYRNLRNGSFQKIAGDIFQHTSWFSMGGAAEDFNRDERVDLVIADMAPTTHYRQKVTMGEMGASFDAMFAAGLPMQQMVNTCFLNTGTNFFFETARQSGISATDWTWAVKSGDLDADGWVDLYFTTGHTRDFVNSDFQAAAPAERIGKEDWDFFEDMPELREHDLAFRNSSEDSNSLRFEPFDQPWGLGGDKTMTYGGVFSDLDRDGDLDLVTMQLEDPPGVYQNLTSDQTSHRSLLIRLEGTQSNRFGVGAQVTIRTEQGASQSRWLLPGNGYLESDEPLVHFGLGETERVSSLEIRWPSGISQRLEDLPSHRWIRVSEPADKTPDKVIRRELPLPLFSRSPVLDALSMREPPFDDYLRQPLLPHRHSQLGPGVAIADVDGDGDEDLYVGGPGGLSGKLLLHRGLDERGDPVFALRNKAPFTEMTPFEDLGVLLLEADGDGNSDLLAVSGGVEGEPGDRSFRDRLYRNEGGEFVESENSLPVPPDKAHASGSVAAAADFDRDGDLDVFIGGRIIPGQYPLPARNRLLRNDGSGLYEDVSEEAGFADSGISETGLVTAATWSDVDGDGWLDLLVTHEWGAIRCFRNEGGDSLRDATGESGLEEATGFWNSITGGDFDGDGDIDFAAGNLGRNTKYKASTKAPELLYYGTFDESGRRNLIEAKSDKKQDQLIPRRGLSCSSKAIPTLTGRIQTYHDWASSSLKQLYTPDSLDKALRFEATTLDSMILWNDGTGKFSLEPLPALAQVAPVFGIAATDFDGDAYCDLVLAQNFFGPQQETGAYDGGLSLFLRGGADGFEPVWPEHSGIVIPGDATALAVGDLNLDDLPDLLFAVNNNSPSIYLNRSGDPARSLVIQLEDDPGNPTAIGAQVTVMIENLPIQAAERTAGSGYLTQNGARLYFSWGKELATTAAEATVRWPTGETTQHVLNRGEGPVFILRKSAP